MADKSNKTLAQEAIEHATGEAPNLMLELARERSIARNDRSEKFDDRATQVAAFQLAAAAVAVTIPGEKASWITLLMAAMASAAFGLGGIVAFRLVLSEPIGLPGLPLAWWKDSVQHRTFDERDAQVWAAGALQDMFDENTAKATVRRKALQLSLYAGAIGVIFVSVTAFSRLLDPPAKEAWFATTCVTQRINPQADCTTWRVRRQG